MKFKMRVPLCLLSMDGCCVYEISFHHAHPHRAAFLAGVDHHQPTHRPATPLATPLSPSPTSLFRPPWPLPHPPPAAHECAVSGASSLVIPEPQGHTSAGTVGDPSGQIPMVMAVMCPQWVGDVLVPRPHHFPFPPLVTFCTIFFYWIFFLSLLCKMSLYILDTNNAFKIL